MENQSANKGAGAEADFNANFVRSKQRRKCIYVQDTQTFVANLKTFMKSDFIEENEAGPDGLNPES